MQLAEVLVRSGRGCRPVGETVKGVERGCRGSRRPVCRRRPAAATEGLHFKGHREGGLEGNQGNRERQKCLGPTLRQQAAVRVKVNARQCRNVPRDSHRAQDPKQVHTRFTPPSVFMSRYIHVTLITMRCVLFALDQPLLRGDRQKENQSGTFRTQKHVLLSD